VDEPTVKQHRGVGKRPQRGGRNPAASAPPVPRGAPRPFFGLSPPVPQECEVPELFEALVHTVAARVEARLEVRFQAFTAEVRQILANFALHNQRMSR